MRIWDLGSCLSFLFLTVLNHLWVWFFSQCTVARFNAVALYTSLNILQRGYEGETWRHWLRPHLQQVWFNVWGVLRNPGSVICIFVFYITAKVFVFHFQKRFICCLKSNVCICRSLTRQRVDHNAVSQWHALLCKWGSFIILMLFMSLIHMERVVRAGSGNRLSSLKVCFTWTLLCHKQPQCIEATHTARKLQLLNPVPLNLQAKHFYTHNM